MNPEELQRTPAPFVYLPLDSVNDPDAYVLLSPAYVGAAYPSTKTTTWIDPHHGGDAFRVNLPIKEVARILLEASGEDLYRVAGVISPPQPEEGSGPGESETSCPVKGERQPGAAQRGE